MNAYNILYKVKDQSGLAKNLADGQDIQEVYGLGEAELLEILDIFHFVLNMRSDYKRV